MFSRILVEEAFIDHPTTLGILSFFKKEPIVIDKIEDIFGRVKKPYLQKRKTLQLLIGRKKGQLIKLAPNAYGFDKGAKHYYFIHAYNCIYECQYCYLQGYFNSPDIVLFLNHEEIIKEMEAIVHQEIIQQKIVQQHGVNENKTIWFHAGEFSDSLALSHLSDELKWYWSFLEKYPQNVFLELRTKSNNLKALKKLPPLKNAIVTYSLSPSESAELYDKKAPSIKVRLKSIKTLSDKNFQLGFHFDPIFYTQDLELQYGELIKQLAELTNWKNVNYISLGVVRFTEGVYKEVKKNYPLSEITAQKLVKTADNLWRYPKIEREWVFQTIKKLLVANRFPEEKIYFCME